MGDLIGGIVGGIGSVVGAGIQANAAHEATQAALTGYRAITSGPAGAFNNEAIAGGSEAGKAARQLLGLEPLTPGVSNGFDNYLKSTGYNFQLKSGSDAITSSNAAKGLLNSGGTLKALDTFGQNLGSNYFNNYLTQIGGQQTAGSNAISQIANAGGTGGGNAVQPIIAGGNAVAGGISGALGGFGGALTNYLARGSNGSTLAAGG